MDQGSEEYYVELLTGSQGRLWGYIHSLTGNADQTQDILQETNRKLWQLRNEYDPARPFAPWAFRVAHNQVRTARKKMQRDQLVFHNEETLNAIAEDYGVWQERVDERSHALKKCLTKLGDEQSKLVREYYHGRCSIEMLAKATGRRANSLAVALHRIRQVLAACIRGELT